MALLSSVRSPALDSCRTVSSAGPETSTPDWMAWAKRTTGFSGADLAGLINEAAMAAAREGSSFVAERHLQVPRGCLLSFLSS